MYIVLKFYLALLDAEIMFMVCQYQSCRFITFTSTVPRTMPSRRVWVHCNLFSSSCPWTIEGCSLWHTNDEDKFIWPCNPVYAHDQRNQRVIEKNDSKNTKRKLESFSNRKKKNTSWLGYTFRSVACSLILYLLIVWVLCKHIKTNHVMWPYIAITIT
jgi:hypothetical protein